MRKRGEKLRKETRKGERGGEEGEIRKEAENQKRKKKGQRRSVNIAEERQIPPQKIHHGKMRNHDRLGDRRAENIF